MVYEDPSELRHHLDNIKQFKEMQINTTKTIPSEMNIRLNLTIALARSTEDVLRDFLELLADYLDTTTPHLTNAKEKTDDNTERRN